MLKGYKAASHWSCREALAGFGASPTDARMVRDRNRITGQRGFPEPWSWAATSGFRSRVA
ncbi:hypothetical protein [Pseudomonas syringae]|uniref:hypothetical protein n=1 Tax=Pseudomonas syringae TaxID=317 RepID=UPI001F082D73|nr:hypothetical protein [Pseudomonas syringae]